MISSLFFILKLITTCSMSSFARYQTQACRLLHHALMDCKMRSIYSWHKEVQSTKPDNSQSYVHFIQL